MPIEGISLEHFSSVSKTVINSTTLSCQRHAVFHYFLSEDRKQDAATTTSHSKSYSVEANLYCSAEPSVFSHILIKYIVNNF